MNYISKNNSITNYIFKSTVGLSGLCNKELHLYYVDLNEAGSVERIPPTKEAMIILKQQRKRKKINFIKNRKLKYASRRSRSHYCCQNWPNCDTEGCGPHLVTGEGM